MFNFLRKKERSLGVAKGKRKYDLPLNKGSGGTFLKILMALMTILAIFALAASFALSEMTEKWSSGMKNKVTIEIPAEDIAGNVINQVTIDNTANELLAFLASQPGVEDAVIMPTEEIKDLVSPWLGDDISFENVPLPGILSVSFKEGSQVDYTILESRLKNYGEHIRLDTHGTWLADLLKFTGALNFAAILITSLIGVTSIVAVAGAIQARMAIFNEELELLHLMGAGDRYIANQLQKHSFFSCIQGSAIGMIIGLALLMITGWALSQKNISLIPDFELSFMQLTALITLPLFIAILGMITARQTVLRVLSKMP